MKKTDAVKIFGTTQTTLGLALGMRRQAISLWPDTLKPDQADRVIGAAVRLGKPIPARFLARAKA